MSILRFHGMARSGNHAILHWILHDASASGRHTVWYNYFNGTEYPLYVIPTVPGSLLIYSFEDSPLDLIQSQDEVLVRDPYNYWASRLRKQRDIKVFIDPFEQRDLWKNHARKMTLSFNEWVVSRSYRLSVANRIGFELHDLMHNSWALENGGSSFGDKNVLDHWRRMKDDKMWQCFFDEEVIQIAKELFPDVCPSPIPYNR